MTSRSLEFSIYAIIIFIAALDVYLLFQSDMAVDWGGYLPKIMMGLGLIALGVFYRHVRRIENFAVVLLGSGAFILFTIVASVLNYLLLPVSFPIKDEQLNRIDAMFGYSWESAVYIAADYPALSHVLRYIYFSSLPQLIIIIVILGFTNQIKRLWSLLAVGLVGVLICMGVWFIFPSFGPTTLVDIPEEIALLANLGVGSEYGLELKRLATQGEQFLTPDNVLGLIAFPSFHTVMALMAVCFLWPVPYIRWAALALNTLMLPAILVHGGHYAVDVIGGVFVFLIAALLVSKIKFIN